MTIVWSKTLTGQVVDLFSPGMAIASELLQRSGRGDQTSFVELYDATASRLYGLVLGVAQDAALAEELTQEVHLHAWRHSARFDRHHGSVLSWIMKIACPAAVERVNQAAPSSRPASAVPAESPCCTSAPPR